MNAKNFQSLCAALLLMGCIFMVLGGLGGYYFGSKSAQEKQEQWILKTQLLNDELSSLQKANATPQPSALPLPSVTPVPPEPLKMPALSEQAAPSNPSAPQSSPHPVPAYIIVGSKLVAAPARKATPPPPGSPVVASPKLQNTPALITFDSGSSSPPPSAPDSKPNTSWTLGDKQRQKMEDALGKYSGKTITICSMQSDTTGFQFAQTLKHAFEDAGWNVDGVNQVAYAKPPVGLNLAAGSFPSPEGLVAAYSAFTSAGFHVSLRLDSQLGGGQMELIVGASK